MVSMVEHQPDGVDVITRASELARRAHAGQVDKAGRPYIEHPAAVAALTAANTDDPRVIATAWLHDVVEDTTVTQDEITNLFGPTVSAAVAAITRHCGESSDEYYRRVAGDGMALLVKRADIAHNSNPQRLAQLPAATRDRLTAKYEHAVRTLNALSAG